MAHENFWKLLGTVQNLREKENKCFVCGSKESIVPHHIKRVKQESAEYYSEDNLLLLCDDCHHLYHQMYPKVNSKTFCDFMRKNLRNQITKKKKYRTSFNINKELKISKLKRIFKSVHKTQYTLVKISVNGELHDISRILDDGSATILEVNIH